MVESERLDAEEAKAKAVECRQMSEAARNPEHRIMLQHMSEVWERIARSMENGR